MEAASERAGMRRRRAETGFPVRRRGGERLRLGEADDGAAGGDRTVDRESNGTGGAADVNTCRGRGTVEEGGGLGGDGGGGRGK